MRLSRAGLVEQWRALGKEGRLLLLYTAIRGLGFSFLSLFFNLYILSLGYQQDFVGLLMSVTSLPAIFLSLPAGLFIRKTGSRRGAIIGGVGGSLMMLLVTFWTSRAALIGTRFLYGCVQALTSVAMFPLVAECANADNRTQLFSAQHSTRTLVTFAGSLLGGVLPTAFALALGVRLESAPAYRATLITGIVVMLLGLAPLFFIPDRPRKAPTRFANSWEVLRNFPQWAKVIANNALILVGASFFVPFFNVFFKEAVGVSDAVLGTIFAVASLMTGFTTLAGPYLSRRWGLAKSVVWLQLASIPFMLIMGSVRWLPAVVLAHWIRMAIVRAASPLSWSFMMGQVSEDEHGVVNGLIMTLSKVSSTIVPYVSGLLQVRYGFAPSFWLGAGVYVIASALMYWFFVRQPDSDRSPAPADQP